MPLVYSTLVRLGILHPVSRYRKAIIYRNITVHSEGKMRYILRSGLNFMPRPLANVHKSPYWLIKSPTGTSRFIYSDKLQYFTFNCNHVWYLLRHRCCSCNWPLTPEYAVWKLMVSLPDIVRYKILIKWNKFQFFLPSRFKQIYCLNCFCLLSGVTLLFQ